MAECFVREYTCHVLVENNVVYTPCHRFCMKKIECNLGFALELFFTVAEHCKPPASPGCNTHVLGERAFFAGYESPDRSCNEVFPQFCPFAADKIFFADRFIVLKQRCSNFLMIEWYRIIVLCEKQFLIY